MKLKLTTSYVIAIGEAILSDAPDKPILFPNKVKAQAVADWIKLELPTSETPAIVSVAVYKSVIRR